jgi:DNA-binding IclR family transcriptional regulator
VSELRRSEKLILDILESVYPKELSIEEIAKITGESRTYVARRLLDMKEKGWVKLRREESGVYFKLKR